MTADAAEIVRLAERVEQATGPDREMDAGIAIALSLPPSASARHGPDAVWACDNGFRWHCPDYTTSLDAAMTLVGDHCWRVEDHPLAGPCALVDDIEGYAATPALALVAAALRARAAQHDHEVG